VGGGCEDDGDGRDESVTEKSGRVVTAVSEEGESCGAASTLNLASEVECECECERVCK
jgi:hypothetical protein